MGGRWREMGERSNLATEPTSVAIGKTEALRRQTSKRTSCAEKSSPHNSQHTVGASYTATAFPSPPLLSSPPLPSSPPTPRTLPLRSRSSRSRLDHQLRLFTCLPSPHLFCLAVCSLAASARGFAEVVRCPLKHRLGRAGGVNLPSKCGQTALWLVCGKGRVEVVWDLVGASGDVSVAPLRALSTGPCLRPRARPTRYGGGRRSTVGPGEGTSPVVTPVCTWSSERAVE